MLFHKMQSLGNDFVVIDCTQIKNKLNSDFFRKISDRHFGIGCDLVAVYKIVSSTDNEIFLEVSFFNSDGSKAEICGNATRCIGLLMKKLNNISTCIMRASNREYKIEVLNDDSIVVHWNSETEIEFFDAEKKLGGSISQNLEIISAYLVSVGNPHCVLFLKKIPELEVVEKVGKQIESHAVFPQKINVEFVEKSSKNSFTMSVYERGAGITLGCGSGAMAVALAAKKCAITEGTQVKIHQRGGDLEINFTNDNRNNNDNGKSNEKNEEYIQIGRAEYIFSGNLDKCFSLSTASTITDNSVDIQNTNDRKNNTDISKQFEKQNIINSAKGKIVVYTDGACSGNPGPGGWGAIIISNQNNEENKQNDPNDNKENYMELFGSEENTTNNRMELTAVIKALEKIPSNVEIEIFTDSQYVKNGITVWIQNWLKNNWKTSDNKIVKNRDLWMQLLELSNNHKIIWKWLKGHNGNKFNEIVDKLARDQIQNRNNDE